MMLATESVALIYSIVDNNGMPLACKAMIRCGLSFNLNGQWEKTQLFQHLQDVVNRHPIEFEGHNPTYE